MLFSSLLSTVLAAASAVASPSPRGVPAAKPATLSPHYQTGKSNTTIKHPVSRSLSTGLNTVWAGPELGYAAVRVSVEFSPNLAYNKHIHRALSTPFPRRGSSTRRASLPVVVQARGTTWSRPSVSTTGRARAVRAGLRLGLSTSAKAPQYIITVSRRDLYNGCASAHTVHRSLHCVVPGKHLATVNRLQDGRRHLSHTLRDVEHDRLRHNHQPDDGSVRHSGHREHGAPAVPERGRVDRPDHRRRVGLAVLRRHVQERTGERQPPELRRVGDQLADGHWRHVPRLEHDHLVRGRWER
jgi:hypothetical protein